MEPEIKWDFKNKRFTINNKPVAGVHPTLHSLFYPNYSWLQARVRAEQASPKTARHQYYGIKAGTQLDKAITKSIDEFHRTGRKPKLAKLSRTAAQFWKLCDLKAWIPVASQVTVGCSTLRVATRIDAVCHDAQGHVILLEIKNGYSYYNEGNAMMKRVYTDHNNSPLNQHQLQLFLNQVLYKRTFPTRVVAGSYVCRFEPGLVDLHPLAGWVVEKAPGFLSCIEHKKIASL